MGALRPCSSQDEIDCLLIKTLKRSQVSKKVPINHVADVYARQSFRRSFSGYKKSFESKTCRRSMTVVVNKVMIGEDETLTRLGKQTSDKA